MNRERSADSWRIGVLEWFRAHQAPAAWGEPTFGWRLLRLRAVPALVLALPAWFSIVWYGARVATEHTRIVAATGDEPGTLVDAVQLLLHKELLRDWNGIVYRPEATRSKHGLALEVDGTVLDAMERSLPPNDGDSFPAALWTKDGRRSVSVRYRGRKPSQWLGPRRSWKVRLEEGHRILGHDVAHFDPAAVEEPLAELAMEELASAAGLLVPRSAVAALGVNGHHLGSYRVSEAVGEATIRRAERFPWVLFSGDGASGKQPGAVSPLFTAAKYWRSVGAPAADAAAQREFPRLLEMVSSASREEFEAYARQTLDLEAFARLEAFDVVFGSAQRNCDEGQKLALDPYRGRWYPVAADFSPAEVTFDYQRSFSPLTLRLGLMVEYAALRDGLVRQWVEEGLPSVRLRAAMDEVAGLYEWNGDAPRLWSAVGPVAAAGDYYEAVLWPMDRQRELRARARILRQVERRAAMLAAELTPRLNVTGGRDSDGAWVAVEVSGRTPVVLSSVTDAQGEQLQWRAVPPAGAPPRSAESGELSPGIRQAPRAPHWKRGSSELEADARSYLFRVQEGGSSIGDALTLRFRDEDALLERRVRLAPKSAPSAGSCSRSVETPLIAASTHPWCEQRSEPRTIEWGPGTVSIEGAVHVGSGELLRIAPGTELWLGPEASLVVEGRLLAEGTASEPIVVRSGGARGVVLRGPGASGSRLTHVRWEGEHRYGSVGSLELPAALNFHDVRGILLEDSVFQVTGSLHDVVHAIYAREVAIRRVRIAQAPLDAFDLEFTEATLDQVDVSGAGDECLDLMGGETSVSEALFANCGGSAISAGELARARLSDLVTFGVRNGIHAKNGSRVYVENVLIAEAEVGVLVERESEWYGGESLIEGGPYWIRDSGIGEQYAKGRAFGSAVVGPPHEPLPERLRAALRRGHEEGKK